MQTEFSDDRLLLRPFRDSDEGALFEAVMESKTELSRWLSWCHADYALADTREFLAKRQELWQKTEHYSFGTFDLRSGRLLGGAGLNFINPLHRFANLGYWVRTSETGKSIAAAAVRLIARFAFVGLQLNRVEIVADVENLASQRAAEKAGATRECIARNRLFLHGHSRDAVIFSLIPQDLKVKSG